MLADSINNAHQSGTLVRGLHSSGTSLNELLNFIKDQLPSWRDRKDRHAATAENTLTSQLAAHLNGAARLSDGWDFLQFRTEVPDETEKGRSIDLVPSPCGDTVWVEGRRCTEFDTLMPIECKRLPTPKGNDRDEREYVVSQHSTTGGIQRFKDGLHGGAHTLGAMIGYIQTDSASTWFDRMGKWIDDLVASNQPGWAKEDRLNLEVDDDRAGVAVYSSCHKRKRNLEDISLRHVWVVMPS